MPDIHEEIEDGDMRYVVDITAKNDFDGLYVGMIRYRSDPATRHAVESQYRTADGQWVTFPLGGTYEPVKIPNMRWPDWAHELIRHAHETAAKTVLTRAIEAVEQRRESSR